MSAETDGYVAEIDYAHAFHAEMAPAHLAFALLLRGIAPPVAPGAAFAYAEPGCGQGLTSNLLAALHPEGRFEANDFLPRHMQGARALAAAASSANVTFLDDDFAALLERPGAPLDIIALHGVWSWISADNRARLTELVKQRLKPGGALYLSYNALPGWAADMPVRRLLQERVQTDHGPLAERIERALPWLLGLADQGGWFDQAPSARRLVESLRDKTASYIAHEYLNRDWACFYHAEVAAGLAPLGLEFGASATLLDHLGPAAASETERDVLAYTRFRRDIFVRQPRRLEPAEREAGLRALVFGLTLPRAQLPEAATTPTGPLDMPEAVHRPLAEALAEGPRSLDQLLADTGLQFQEALTALVTLCGLGAASPVPAPHPHRADRCTRLNRAILEANRHSPAIRQLAAPALGTALQLDLLERLFLLGEQEGQDPAAVAWDVLKARGKRLRKDGDWLEGDAANLAELRRLHGLFTQGRRDWLRGCGVG